MESNVFDKKYRFTTEWFDIAIPTWTEVFVKNKQQVKDVLEVGCYEGRATVWLCENVLTESGSTYDVVDTFEGSLSESGMIHEKEQSEQGVLTIENNFRHNIQFFPDIKFSIYKGYSQKILPQLSEKKQYDLIYIDASHRADDTLVDSYFAHKLLKPGGILIFDDFGWKDPKDLSPINSPELGIRMFWQLYGDQYGVLFQGYQVGFMKKVPNKITLT